MGTIFLSGFMCIVAAVYFGHVEEAVTSMSLLIVIKKWIIQNSNAAH